MKVLLMPGKIGSSWLSLCNVGFDSAIRALMSRIMDSFFFGASFGTKSKADKAKRKKNVC